MLTQKRMANSHSEWIKVQEGRIYTFLDYCESLPGLYDRIKESQQTLATYGVSSPTIMSREEAKYQKGTKTYSDARLLDMIEQKDILVRDYLSADHYCWKVQQVLVGLSPDDINLLYLRYECGYSYRQLGDMYYRSKDAIQKRIVRILESF